ncbi:MAG TPA: YqaJ viral recombinase family protein [Kofleriaceae bacterium]|nr:YqaJ viral recombinase family protein [Kofleriaceae bacterium]
MVATAGQSNLSPEQLAERAQGITATDVAAIVGVHPYRSAVDVWSDKLGLSAPFVGNDRTKWGNILEPVIRSDYEERKGVRVETRGTLTHHERTWMKATPDGLVYVGSDAEPDRGLEIKCHTMHLAYLYGSPGSDEVPQYELCQVGWNMAVTELQRWDLVAFIDGQPTDYVIDRDDELIDMLRERAERFRHDYVLAKTPPPPDGSEAYTAWLNAQHASDNALAALVDVSGDVETMRNVERLRTLRDEIVALEAQEGLVVQSLKARIGDHAGIAWPNGKPAPKKGKLAGQLPVDKITWKKSKDGVRTDYAAAFHALKARAQLVASANADAAHRAITALDKLADQYFANTRATTTGKEIRATLEQLRDLAVEVAHAEPATAPAPGSRRFLVPKHWKGTADSADE